MRRPRAHVEDGVDFAMPVSGRTGGHAASDAGGGDCAGVAAIGRRASRAGGAQMAEGTSSIEDLEDGLEIA